MFLLLEKNSYYLIWVLCMCVSVFMTCEREDLREFSLFTKSKKDSLCITYTYN